MNKRRFKTIQWAASSFLFKASKSSNKKRKIKQWIILALRTLSVAAIIFLIARPYSNSSILGAGDRKVDTVIVLLDRSPSMEDVDSSTGLSKRELALRMAYENIQAYDALKVVLIESTTNIPQILPGDTTFTQSPFTRPSSKEANIPQMLTSALDYIKSNAIAKSEIWLLSDMQDSAWQSSDGIWSQLNVELESMQDISTLKVIPFTDLSERNLAVEVTKVIRSNTGIEIESTIHQSPMGTLDSCMVTYQINSSNYHIEVPLKGERTVFRKSFKVAQTSGSGSISLSDTKNQDDNTAYFTYSKPRTAFVSLVVNDPESHKYLSAAASTPNKNEVIVESFSEKELLPLDQTTLLVWQAPMPREAFEEQIEQYIRHGGIALFFPPTTKDDHSFLNQQWLDINKAPQNDSFTIRDWNHIDGPLRDGNDGTAIALDRVEAIQLRGLKSDATAIACWSDGSPALLRQHLGQGIFFAWNSLPNYYWSSLGNGDVIVPMISRLIDQGLEKQSNQPFLEVGSEEAERRFDTGKWKPVNQNNTLLDPRYQSGLFKEGEKYFAQNRSSEEMRSTILSMQEVNQLVPNATLSQRDGRSRPSPLWQVFAYLALAFLLCEAVMSSPIPMINQIRK